MRIFLIALLLVASATAQPDFSGEDHLLRVAFGDIPTTTAIEQVSAWNFQETIKLENGTHQINAPAFAQGRQLDCNECVAVTAGNGWEVTVSNPTTAIVTYRAPGDVPFAATVRVDGPIVLFAPEGTHVESNRNVPAGLIDTQGRGLEIYQLDGTGNAWFTVDAMAPATVTVSDDRFDFVALLIGLITGLAIWAFLVQRGLVQKRQRKQIAGKAVHKEAAKTETPDTLQGRKRILMAGLKELELAKMNQEMDTLVYDVLKADFKKQTVTVMRAIEEAKVE